MYDYPENVDQLGSSPACEVQGMHVKGHLFTVQGHPEFNEAILREILDSRYQLQIFDDDFFDDAIGRVGNQHDGVLVGKAFLKFLLED